MMKSEKTTNDKKYISGWLENAKAINDPRYGTYWKPEQKSDEVVEVATPAPVVIVNAPTQATEAVATTAEEKQEELPEEPAEIQLKGANVRASSTTTTTTSTTTTTTYKRAEAVDLPADWGKKKELDSFVKYLSNEEEEIEELIEEEEEIVEEIKIKSKFEYAGKSFKT